MANDIEILKLSEVLTSISHTIKRTFRNPIWVEAEISNISSPSSGHKYFDLVEYNGNGNIKANVKANLWRNNVSKIFSKFENNTNEPLKKGIKVLLKLEPNFHTQYGLSFTILDIEPAFTLGIMEKQVLDIRNNLIKNKIYDLNKELVSPNDFFNIAVISPSEAAGLKDFTTEINLLEKNNLIKVDYFTSLFQGKDTKTSISSSLNSALSKDNNYDAIVVIRGGGSKTDLHFVNEYEIAEIICKSKIPVIIGIGHEVDKTILDEVANISLGTPSKVANFIFSTIINNTEKIEQNFQYILKFSEKIIFNYELKVNELLKNIKNKTIDSIFKYEKSIEQSLNDIKFKSKEKIRYVEENIKHLYSNIFSISPQKTIERGYSIIYKESKVINSIKDISKNEKIEIQLKDGQLNAKII